MINELKIIIYILWNDPLAGVIILVVTTHDWVKLAPAVWTKLLVGLFTIGLGVVTGAGAGILVVCCVEPFACVINSKKNLNPWKLIEESLYKEAKNIYKFEYLVELKKKVLVYLVNVIWTFWLVNMIGFIMLTFPVIW